MLHFNKTARLLNSLVRSYKLVLFCFLILSHIVLVRGLHLVALVLDNGMRQI